MGPARAEVAPREGEPHGRQSSRARRRRRCSLSLPPTVRLSATARSIAAAWVVLAVLTSVYVLNFLDRQLLSILAKPIQDSQHLTYRQLALIRGLYFALFY